MEIKTENPTIKAGILYRHSALQIPNDKEDNNTKNDSTKGDNDKNRSFSISFSSEEPVERYFGIEILDHNSESIKLDWFKSGNAPLLLDHDPTKQIGIVESAEIGSDGKARAKIRFGKNKLAESSYQDVLDGIKANISVGYRYLQDGIILEQKAKDNKPDIYRINKWEPLEVSLVSIPADHTVGIGRTNQQNHQHQQETIFKVRNKMQANNTNAESSEHIAAINQINTKQITEDIRHNETARISEIIALGDKHNMREAAMEFVREGKSLDNFRAKVLENLGNTPIINTTAPEKAMIGLSQKEARDFSILRAIRAAVAGNWSGAEFEKEASMEVAKKLGREPASFFVPLEVTHQRNTSDINIRGLEKLVNIAGGYLVPTDYLSNNFIELLRNKMLVKQMGARVMSGLHGDVAIPKQTGGASASWVSEGQDAKETQQTFGQVTLSPKSVAAYTDFTRKLILQSSPDIETLVRNDLATVIALEIDRAAISGSGNGAEPQGILNTRGVSAVKYQDADKKGVGLWGKIVDLESEIAAQNADIGTLGYLCNARMRGMLKATEKSEGTGQFLWENKGAERGFGYLNGYKIGTTNQMPADTIIFGNFSDLIIGQWGVLDVLVDPYALGKSGGIRIRIMQDVDIAVRHPESFAVLKR